MGHPKWFSDVLDWQTRNPLKKLPLEEMVSPAHRQDGWASHLNKREMRQLLPILGKLTGLHFSIYQVGNHLAAVFFFGALAYVIRNITGDAGIAVLSSIAYALSYAGAHFFYDDFFGDGVAFALLLLSVCFQRPVIVALSIALAGMADERASVAALLSYCFWQIQAAGTAGLSARKLFRPSCCAAAVLAGVAITLAWRMILVFRFGLATGNTDLAKFGIVLLHTSNYPGNIFMVFGWLWSVVVLGFAAVWATVSRMTFAFLALFCCVSLLPSLLVLDLSRSIAFSLVLLPLAFALVPESEAQLMRLAAMVSFVGNLFFAQFPDALQRLAVHWLA